MAIYRLDQKSDGLTYELTGPGMPTGWHVGDNPQIAGMAAEIALAAYLARDTERASLRSRLAETEADLVRMREALWLECERRVHAIEGCDSYRDNVPCTDCWIAAALTPAPAPKPHFRSTPDEMQDEAKWERERDAQEDKP